MSAEERVDLLRTRVERQQQTLRLAVADLEVAARNTVDPRHWIAQRPVFWTLGAFAFGAWLGARRSR